MVTSLTKKPLDFSKSSTHVSNEHAMPEWWSEACLGWSEKHGLGTQRPTVSIWYPSTKHGYTNFKMQRQVRNGAYQWFDNIVPCIMLSFRIWTGRIQAIVGGVLELSASSCCKPSRMISIGVLDHLWACRHQMCIRRDQGKPDTKLSSLYNDL